MGRCEANSDVNYNIKAFSSSKKYLMTSYFGKYEKLLDSNFEEFIANELRTSFCEVLPDNTSSVVRRSVLLRHLIGEGSHRNLLSSMRFYVDPKSLSRPPFHKCELIVIERLPSGIFADPFELQHLHQRGGKLHWYFVIKFLKLLKSMLIVLLTFVMLIIPCLFFCSFNRCSCFRRYKLGITFISFQPVCCWNSHECWFQ